MKKVLIVGMVLVLALAAIGVGYSHWTKDAYIEGVVNTGTFDLEISQGDPFDNEQIKDVGWGWCDVVAQDTVILNVENAYPSYMATFPIDIHCLGSVPLHVNQILVDADPYLDVRVMYQGRDITDGIPDFIQLHECDSAWFDVQIHVLQNHPVTGELCPEGAQFGARVTFVCDQFNYVP